MNKTTKDRLKTLYKVIKKTIKLQEDANFELNKEKTYELTWQLLNLLLGSSAYKAVSKVCEKDYEASEPQYSLPQSINPATVNPITASAEENQTEEALDCEASLTTVTAQATKTQVPIGFYYDVSWTIAPCKENLTYTAYLANSTADRIGIAFGSAKTGETKAETKQFSYTKDYADVCIQVSDTSIGDNGYSCFAII